MSSDLWPTLYSVCSFEQSQLRSFRHRELRKPHDPRHQKAKTDFSTRPIVHMYEYIRINIMSPDGQNVYFCNEYFLIC